RYPPFSTLVRIVCSSEVVGAAAAAAAAVRARLDDSSLASLGPAPLFRLRGRERSPGVGKASERGPWGAGLGAGGAGRGGARGGGGWRGWRGGGGRGVGV